ncbi:ECF transporter S component [Xylanimonas allomyrinae]|uniref:ECF transporter S component n=1 Tax=Xylanimonas allomyrinae TaxID=2509459 RepID=A0A4V0YE84_9MICO|nr:ECF transporter S component [Xylanimonas allomyrinae]QAY63321.1 ECF transporter S component [Xylanimonas allomyrinae]
MACGERSAGPAHDPGRAAARRPLPPRSRVTLTAAALIGLVAFTWPLLVDPAALVGDDRTGASIAPVVMGAVLLVVAALVLVELSGREVRTTTLAMLGVLAAIGAIVRPLGAGAGGLETVFFLIVLGGRAFGAGFGYLLGALTIFASALVTAGVGPWMPYQMIGAAFVGLGAGLLPPTRAGSRAELALLGAYGFVASFAYGYLVDLAFWPFVFGTGSQAGFDPSAGAWSNLRTFAVVNTVTSLGWNLGRAVTCVVLIAVLGPGLLHALRRASRRAVFAA